MTEIDQLAAAEVALRESELRDELEGIGRQQLRIVLSYVSIMAILAAALVQGSFGFPAATLGILILVPLKKAIMRYRSLASKRTELLNELDSMRILEG